MSFKSVLLFTGLVWCLALGAQQADSVAVEAVEAWDNSSIDLRRPTADTIDYYRQMAEYDYREIAFDQGWFNKFLEWLGHLLTQQVSGKWVWAILIIAAVLALLFLIVRLLGIPIKGLFVFSRSTRVTELHFGPGEMDLEHDNLEKLLRTYISNAAFREATRVLFHLTLRELNRLKYIRWSVWKTDREYYYEIKDPELKKEFLSVIRLYEYVWYGKFEPAGEQFQGINERFELFIQQVKSQGR